MEPPVGHSASLSGNPRAGYRVVAFSANRHMAAASASVCRERNTIHAITDVDVPRARERLREHRRRSGEALAADALTTESQAP